MELAKIPGLRESLASAESEEAAIRDFAQLGLPDSILGVSVKQFTPRMFLFACLAKSPFLLGGEPTPEDVAAFLWIVSPSFSHEGASAKAGFLESIVDLPFIESVTAIDDYLSRSLMDRPPSVAGGRVSPFVSLVTPLVHQICDAYGWARDEVLDTPFAVLYQHVRMIHRDHNPKAVFFNRLSDRAKKEAVNNWLESQKKPRKKRRKNGIQ